MSSLNLRDLASESPDQKLLLEELGRLFESGAEYNFDRLVDLLHPASRDDLSQILVRLVKMGQLNLVFRVEDPTSHGGLFDYRSFEEIPRTVHNWRTDREIPVTTDNLRLVYQAKED